MNDHQTKQPSTKPMTDHEQQGLIALMV